jgi:signal transduction histidine kinase
MKERYLREKRELELQNARLYALFAELDPDPLVRINNAGEIINCNESAKILSKDGNVIGKNISEIVAGHTLDHKELIENDKTFIMEEKILGRFYMIHYRGIKYLGIAQIYFHDVTERKLYEEKLEQYQQRLKELSHNIQTKAEEERYRIAKELHDSIGQHLSLLKLKMQGADITSDRIKDQRKELTRDVDSIINEVREISYKLKPKVIDELGLAPAVASLIDSINTQSSLKGELSVLGSERRYEKSVEINLYRIIQEAINNVIKHSRATEFSIQLIYGEETIKMIISDNGIGTGEEQIGKGLGFLSMRERAEAFGGTLKLDFAPGAGTTIITEIPNIITEIPNKAELKND